MASISNWTGRTPGRKEAEVYCAETGGQEQRATDDHFNRSRLATVNECQMPQDMTNFDDYLARKRAAPEFNRRFEAADQAWDNALAATADRERASRRAIAAAALQRRAAERGLDWTQMSEAEREAFIDDLVHEDR